MRQVSVEDSIDDLISLLNSHKESKRPSSNSNIYANPVNQENINIDPDIAEWGHLLNSPFAKVQPRSAPSNQGIFEQDKFLSNKVVAPLFKEKPKQPSKNDFVSRNFLNKTTNYPSANSTAKDFSKEFGDEKPEEDTINVTRHPKNAIQTSTIRYLKFQPLTKDIRVRPTTPPDHGYYFKFYGGGEVKLIKHLLEDNGFKESSNNYSFSLMWSCGAIKNETYQSLGYYQKVNHFPRSHEITRKDSMHRNISAMQTTYGLKNFNFIPKSFILPQEFSLLQADAEKNKGMQYIVKPQASSQGRGIFITSNLDEISAKQGSQIIVSHYLNDPYLINGLKFDLRVYVAITSIHPLRIYVYKEGLTRFATVPYSKDAYNNRFQHLTNYSINKNSENYVANEESDTDQESCSKWTFATFRNYLESQGIDHKAIFQKIDDLVVKTVLSIESILFSANIIQVPQRHNCFELLGFDVLLDSKLKPWLLEANLSPSLACESSLDLKIKGELIADLFNLAGVVPLDQRTYNENASFGKNQNLLSYGVTGPSFVDKKSTANYTNYNESKSLENLTKEEKTIIRETNEEWERRGKFRRVYPSANVNDYKNFFENDRPYNKLLRTIINNNLKGETSTRKAETFKQTIKKFG